MKFIKTQPKEKQDDDTTDIQVLDSELERRNEIIRSKIENGMGAITEWMKDLEEKFKKREMETLQQIELEYQQKFVEAEQKLKENLQKREERIVWIESEFKKKSDDLKNDFEKELLKKTEEFHILLEKKDREKEAAMLSIYKVIEAQNEILTKIMEKNEKLMLEVLSELNISFKDLKKMLETSAV